MIFRTTRSLFPGFVFRRSALVGALLLGMCGPGASSTSFYVSGHGQDTADGLSPAHPFATLQHAAGLARAGDLVNVMNGTYTNAKAGGTVLSITTSGTPEHWIKFQAAPGEHPKLVFNGWEGVAIRNTAAYIEVSGLTIVGNNRNVTLDGARRQGKVGDPAYSGNCVFVEGRGGTATLRPHHIRILNNTIGECGGGGITTIQADYVTVSNNIVYDSAWYAIYGCSGISMLENWNSDNSTQYKMVVTNNRIFGNKELIPWVKAGKITDGEGIIVDTSRSPALGPYRGRTLIANNVVYQNGSAAIEVFRSDHVDIVNNSTYANVQVPERTGAGELMLNEVTDIHILNNIFFSAGGQNPVNVNSNKECLCFFENNLYFNGPNLPADIKAKTDLRADPQYLDPAASDRFRVNLGLAPTSPAVDSGSTQLAPSTDFLGNPRPQGKAIDRGAYEQ